MVSAYKKKYISELKTTQFWGAKIKSINFLIIGRYSNYIHYSDASKQTHTIFNIEHKGGVKINQI